MKQKLRAAVIGVGYLGNFHAQKYKTLGSQGDLKNEVELVGVCDLQSEVGRKVGSELGVPWYTHPEQMLGKVDLVSIASVTPAHFDLVRFFLENNVHVNVEKPICTRYDEAQKLTQLSKIKGLVLAVGHSERFNLAFVEAKKRINNKNFIEFQRHAPFKERGAEVNVILDLMIHDLDLMLSLDHSRVKVKMATGSRIKTQTYDWAMAAFEFESGTHAVIQSSRISSQLIRQMRVVQKDSILHADLQSGVVEQVKVSPQNKDLVIDKIETGRGDSLLLETEIFIKAILQKGSLWVTGDDGTKALYLAEEVIAAIESSRVKE